VYPAEAKTVAQPAWKNNSESENTCVEKFRSLAGLHDGPTGIGVGPGKARESSEAEKTDVVESVVMRTPSVFT
jgi:hypothetical protein